MKNIPTLGRTGGESTISFPSNNPIQWGGDIDGLATRGRSPEYADDILRSMFKSDIAQAKEERPTEWYDKRDTVIENIGELLQCEAADTYLFIADEEAFDFNRLRLLYLDPFRNSVREGRLDAEWENIGGVMNSWRDSLMTHQPTMVGDKYRVNGELGKHLYQLKEEDRPCRSQVDRIEEIFKSATSIFGHLTRRLMKVSMDMFSDNV